MTRSPLLAVILLTAACVGEDPAQRTARDARLAAVAAEADAAPGEALPVERRFAADSTWRVVWGRGGPSDPDFTYDPRALAFAGEQLAVLDQAERALIVLDAATGATRWRVASIGAGPGDFRWPTQVAGRPAGGFAVYDVTLSRISEFDARGRFIDSRPVTNDVESMCAQHDGDILVKLRGHARALVRLDTAGRRQHETDLPWTIDTMLARRSVGMLASAADGRECVFASQYGSDWLVLDSLGTVRPYRYIETVPPPIPRYQEIPLDRGATTATVSRVVTWEGESSARSVHTIGDTVVVLFNGRTRDASRVLDYYERRTGRYLYSRKLPAKGATALAIGPDGLVVMAEILPDVSAISAIRPQVRRDSVP